MAKATSNGLTYKHAGDAWTIYNIVKTLHAALPDDPADCEVPTRCLLSHVLGLAEALASTLTELRNAQ